MNFEPNRTIQRPRPPVLSFQMLKGGVAKTTLCRFLAQYLSTKGLKVLVCDFDPQGNLTESLGVKDFDYVLLDILEKRVAFAKALVAVSRRLWVLPSNLNNSVVDKFLIQNVRNWSKRLHSEWDQLKDFDVILVDTAPSLSLINTLVTLSSDLVILPVNCDHFSALGLKLMAHEIRELEQEFDARISWRVIVTRFEKNLPYHQQFLDVLKKEFPGQFRDSWIIPHSRQLNRYQVTRTNPFEKGLSGPIWMRMQKIFDEMVQIMGIKGKSYEKKSFSKTTANPC